MSDPHSHSASEPDPGAIRRRDQGLRRTSNATRWSFAAAAAGTAALGVTYLDLLPGTSGTPAAAPAAATAGQAANGWACTTKTAPAPAPAAARQVDDEARTTGESDDRAAAPAPAPALQSTTTCVSQSGSQGLTPPGQPPAATQQAPQTRTGAS